jgi:hypothetical protein
MRITAGEALVAITGDVLIGLIFRPIMLLLAILLYDKIPLASWLMGPAVILLYWATVSHLRHYARSGTFPPQPEKMLGIRTVASSLLTIATAIYMVFVVVKHGIQ